MHRWILNTFLALKLVLKYIILVYSHKMHVIVNNIISGEVCKFGDHSSNNIRDIGPIAAGQKCKNYPSKA